MSSTSPISFQSDFVHARQRTQSLSGSSNGPASSLEDSAQDEILSQTSHASSLDGIFARHLVHDLRAVLAQARTGNSFSENVISFVREVAELQNQFANRLAKIVDRQMVKFAVHDGGDGMQGVRQVWLQTMEESRSWATSSKQMSVNMLRTVDPLRRAHQSSVVRLQHIIEENDRLSRPLLDQQTSIVRKQLRSNKVTMPMLEPSFRTMSGKKRDKIVAKARVEVVKYLNEVNRVNRWISDVITIARPKMLNTLQSMEEDRIQRTLHVLSQYSHQVQATSVIMGGVASTVQQRLKDYHMPNDVEAFVEHIASRPQLDREYLAPFPYRLPVTLRDLNIDESIVETPAKTAAVQNRMSTYRKDNDDDVGDDSSFDGLED